MNKLRILALLLALAILMTSCDLLGLLNVTTSQTTTQMIEEYNPLDDWSRSEHSTTAYALEQRISLSQDDVDEIMLLLERIRDGAIVITEESNGEECDQSNGDVTDSLPIEPLLTYDELLIMNDDIEKKYYHIEQQVEIAFIVYYCNFNDNWSKNRYLNFQSILNDIYAKYLECYREIYYHSPYSEDFFANWSESSISEMIGYTPEITALQNEIDLLETEYNSLDQYRWEDKSARIYAQLVVKRNELAKLYGYDNYYDYASVEEYGREYSESDLASMREYAIEYLLDWVATLDDELAGGMPSEEAYLISHGNFDKIGKNYVIRYLHSLNGNMGESMRGVFEDRNCILNDNYGGYNGAFKTYLYEDKIPFCYFGYNYQNSTTIIHEIGHYYAGVMNEALSSYDLLEIHSIGNEFLFMKYCESIISETDYNYLKKHQIADTLFTVFQPMIIDEFEQAVYSIESVEDYTSEDFDKIMLSVCEKYGGYGFVSNYLSEPYQYWRLVTSTNPVYYISYTNASLMALQLYAIAEEDYDAAIDIYTTLVEGVTPEDAFLGALAKAGLSTPFEEETYIKISTLFEE